MMPAAMISATACAGLHDAVESGQHHARGSGHRQQFDGDFDHHAQHALGAGHQRQQIVAGAVQRSEPMVSSSPSMVTTFSLSTLCTVRPYFRQCTPPEFSATLPPMRAGHLRGGVGRVVQAEGGRRLAKSPGCARRAAPGQCRRCGSMSRIRLNRARLSSTPSAQRQGAAGKAGAGAARHHRHVQRVTDAHDGLDLLHRFRHRHQHRQLLENRQPVALVRAHGLFVGEHGLGGQQRAQFGEKSRLLRRCFGSHQEPNTRVKD